MFPQPTVNKTWPPLVYRGCEGAAGVPPRGNNPMKKLIALVPAGLPRGGIHPTEVCL